MPWLSWWGTQRSRSRSDRAGFGELRAGEPRSGELRSGELRADGGEAAKLISGDSGGARDPGGTLDLALRLDVPAQRKPEVVPVPVTMRRVGDSLDRLEIRYLTDNDGSLLAMWERHALLFALEGPDDEILVMRGRPHATVPPDWADRSYRVVNEWNHTRRFCKAYVGDPTERGQLPIYAEIQVPLLSGVHDALLDELLDCAAAVTTAFVDWLHDEGALL
jgi:hypothetical protein